MATLALPQKKILEILKLNTLKTDADFKKKGVKLNAPRNPIFSKDIDDAFTVTLTGEITISEREGVKSAHYLTKEGYIIKVNTSHNNSVHKEGAVLDAICRMFTTKEGTEVKYTDFV